MSPIVIAILMFVTLIIFVLLGYPVAFVFAGLAFIFGLVAEIPSLPALFASRIYGGLMTSYDLVALPLFVFMGVMLERSGLAERLYEAMHIWMGGLRGGMAIGTIIICTLFAASTGVVGATVVMMGLLALPTMLSRGYQIELATGTICAGGTLGILIPPSIMLIVFGTTAGLSVGKLFMGAIFPGLLLSALFIAYIAIRCFFQPRLAPAAPVEERAIPLRRKLSLGLTSLIPPIFLIIAVLGTIFLGIAAPTEAAAIGAFGSLLLAAGYRRLSPKVLGETAILTLKMSSMVLFTAVGAFMFTGVFAAAGASKAIEELLYALPMGPWGVLGIMMFILLILGALLDWISISLIFIPIFLPIAKGLGFDPLWFCLLIGIMLQTSFLTPPTAPSIFYLKGACTDEVEVGSIMRGIIPFMLLQLLGLALVIAFPQIALWLPGKMIR